MDWNINYTHAAYRTFNAPVKDYEKYIYKNYPIGHFLGNNFWELKSTLSWRAEEKFHAQMTLYYLEAGEEALYSPFNKDYLNYTVKQGYEENFPFGKIITQYGFESTIDYNITDNILLKNNLSYWFKKGILENNFNYSFGIVYHY